MSELVIDAVTRRYPDGTLAVRGLSLTLGPGVCGLLGPNGAGKSTLIRIVATVDRPTSGRVLWDGRDVAREPNRLRATLGYLPQEFGVYPELTAREFLTFLAAAKGLVGPAGRSRVEAVLELVNLERERGRLGGFSGGMKRRVGIAQALLTDPQLLVVDEPTVGLDPEERVRFRNLLAGLAADRVVILSTHIVSDVEATATSIALVRGGRLLSHGAPEELLGAHQGTVWHDTVDEHRLADLVARHQVSSLVRRSAGAEVRVVAAGRPTPTAVAVAPTLEEAYLSALHEGADA